MLPEIILRRMRREYRTITVLLLALSLVTAFLALGPLYVRAVASAEFNVRLDQAPEQIFRVDLINPQPFDETAISGFITEELGALVTGITRFWRSTAITCGFLYLEGQSVTANSPRTDRVHCYRPSAYHEFSTLFTIIAGRAPQQNLGGVVEVAVAARALERALALDPDNVFGIGSRFVVGTDPNTAITVEIVGIVQPNLPEEHPLWDGQPELFGSYFPVSDNLERIDMAFIMTEDDFRTRAAPATTGMDYFWRVGLDRALIRADDLDALSAHLAALDSRTRDLHPGFSSRTDITHLISAFRDSIAQTEGPITLLSLMVLGLMLVNLVTTVALILEQQGEEWAAISSRGGSVRQLVLLQFGTILPVATAAFLLGPLLAFLVMNLLTFVGPQSAFLSPADVSVIPFSAAALSFAAAAAAVIVLTLPAYPAARSSILRLKQSISRPPVKPSWARYFLDAILLVLGALFLLRLYGLVGGDVGTNLSNLFQDPAALARLLASGSGLNDPFNLLGPLLLLTGAALLWMRLFPLLMRLVGGLLTPLNGLTVRLALWNVEREPGHYGQLVVLLVGTLALGTASLTLTATRDAGAITAARQETGGDLRLLLDPYVPERADWSALPDSQGGAAVLIADANVIPPNPPTALIGIDPVAFSTVFPVYASAAAPLLDAPTAVLPGLALPEDTVSLALDVLQADMPDSEPGGVRVAVELLDTNGVRGTLLLEAPTAAPLGQFVTYSATLTRQVGRAPWRIVGLRFIKTELLTQNPERIENQLYLDNLVALTADSAATVILDFEPDSLPMWLWTRDSNQMVELANLANDTESVTQGANSLRVLLRFVSRANSFLEPVLQLMPVQAQPIPAVISSAFARTYGARSGLRRDLRVGDSVTSTLQMPFGISTPVTDVRLDYQVVAVVDSFPTMVTGQEFLVTTVDHLRRALNAYTRQSNYYDINQVWLNLNTLEPDTNQRATVAALPGITQATFAWDRYQQIQREPLPNALTGILFASFWVSLSLSLLDFAFYMAVTTRRRAVSFAVLRSIGWDAGKIWGLLTVEQAAFITPALFVGVTLGTLLAYLILPFLGLIGASTLQVPVMGVLGLLLILIASFTLLLSITAHVLRRASLNRILRLE